MAGTMKASSMMGAAADLGLGTMLGQQVQDETDEQRKKRMREQQSGGQPSPAAISLLGGYDAGGG